MTYGRLGADLGDNHCDVHRMVRSRGLDGSRPGVGAMVSADEPDGSCLMAERFACAQRRWSSPTTPRSRSREGPRRGEEILRFVL
jgi:hypothetical protein